MLICTGIMFLKSLIVDAAVISALNGFRDLSFGEVRGENRLTPPLVRECCMK